MENGFSASDAVLTSAMSGGFAGRGQWGGYGYGEQFAGPASNAVRINEGNRATAAGIENLLDQNQFSATNKNIVDGHSRICDSLNAADNRNSDRFAALSKDVVDSEFRSIARENALRAEANANNIASIQRDHDAALKAQECCCKLEAEIKASEARSIQRDLDTANRQLSEQTIINTISQRCGCCPPPSAG